MRVIAIIKETIYNLAREQKEFVKTKRNEKVKI